MKLITIQSSPKDGQQGGFASCFIPKGQHIVEFLGPVCRAEKLPNPYVEADYMQVGPDLYMGPSGNEEDYLNHSCSPNAFLCIEGNGKDLKVNLLALRNIQSGEEITYDYSLTMWNDPWEISCNCGVEACRGTIYEFSRLPQERKKAYAGIVPPYVWN